MTTSTTILRAHWTLPQTLLPIRQTDGLDNHPDRALAAVRPRLRALRRQRETTLADLSAATGIQ